MSHSNPTEITRLPYSESPPSTEESSRSILLLSDEELYFRLQSLSGAEGFSGSIRGLFKTPDGQTVFVKRARDSSTFTQEAYRRETDVYAILSQKGFSALPHLLASDGRTLVLEDMSRMDFSDKWTEEKISAAFTAMQLLAEVPAGEDLEPFALPNGWTEMANDPTLVTRLRELMGDDYDDEINLNLNERAEVSDAFLMQPGVVSHGDVRGDNFAYDPVSKTGKFVDWNWCGTAPPSKDRTELLISIAESGYPVTDEMVRAHCSADAALMLAGYWFANCVKPAWEGGETVRVHQLESAKIAWEWYKRLAHSSTLDADVETSFE